MKIIDYYFRVPILLDYVIGFIVLGFLFLILPVLPGNEKIVKIISDITNSSFTVSGFVLTILTIIITLKGRSSKKENIKEYDSAMELFLHTPLFQKTVGYLKNCLKSLLLISVMGYIIKILDGLVESQVIFGFAIIFLVVLSMTLFRCMLILGKILRLQNQ